ncbi:MAG: inositol monophosphatase family protein [Bowdeniella nasicola]|nr:inositol monophosphatase family protein [Bowdeniella nasicola]
MTTQSPLPGGTHDCPPDLLDIATDIAVRAAHLAAMTRDRGVRIAAAKSTPTDIVTEADRATEAFIRDLLTEERSADGFYGEESGTATSTSGYTWVVDPIDGTVNYAYDLPAWAVSVAVVAHGEQEAYPETWRPVAGVVVNPRLGEVWRAATGRGASLARLTVTDRGEEATPEEAARALTYELTDHRPLRLEGERALATSLIATGFAYDPQVRVTQAEQVLAIIDRCRDIRRFGAASLDLVGVAAGRVDAYFERGLHPYDHAAGALIAREAGALVWGPGGGRENEDLTVVTHPALAEQLDALLKEIGADPTEPLSTRRD